MLLREVRTLEMTLIRNQFTSSGIGAYRYRTVQVYIVPYYITKFVSTRIRSSIHISMTAKFLSKTSLDPYRHQYIMGKVLVPVRSLY